MIDPKASILEVSLGNRDLSILQSPAVLNSAREGGTTGAVVWKVTPRFTEWIASADNVLHDHGILHPGASVLELGSGIAGILPLGLKPYVGKFIATDQQYALKLLRENIERNANSHPTKRGKKSTDAAEGGICVLPLDWETDDVQSLLKSSGSSQGVDMVVACDCIYNYALIQPFIQTCIDVCSMRSQEPGRSPTVCVVAQQLRQPDVMEEWLTLFMKHFRTWRISDEVLTSDLREGSGFVIHVGVLRGTGQVV